MAYRTTRTRRRVTRRKSRYTKRRPTRSLKRRYQSKRITNKRILNVSSEKKSDSRVFYTNLTAPGTPPVFSAPVLLGGTTYAFIHMPTAMDKSNAVSQDIGNFRDRSDVYMRGFSETLRMTTNGGDTWNWRRLVFTLKGPAIYSNISAASALYLESASNGWTRTWVNHNSSAVGGAALGLLFKGNLNTDWVDPFTATVDTSKVGLLYDKYQVLKAGNGENNVHNRKMWHPFNKMFYYADDENGSTETESVVHVASKQGMGDVYIMDLFLCADANPSQTMQLDGTARLYWHEK